MTASACQRLASTLLAVACATLVCTGAAAAGTAADTRWCAPELAALGEHTCFFEPQGQPKPASARVLVIFLHGLVGDGSSWQWEQQRLMSRTAAAYGFSALMPRGRLGIGPGRDPAVRAWPNSAQAQQAVESEVLAELSHAQRA